MFFPTPLNLPPHSFKITEKDNVIYIFDELRKKHLILTPEEWVRQHFIQYLINTKKFPKSLIQIEGGLILNQLQKRSDILVYNAIGEKLMLVECKAPKIKITNAVFEQASRYNSIHQAKWIVLTNGLKHVYAQMDLKKANFSFIENLPNYEDL
ncbi:type I restriction enzyme HsdR N-terminal domain-containing protein [Pedobacter changchengzhani]|uniref:Type I restriction enzyme HsdR N-terminal domain-containing protein n=1 Tax=Pedobacter changchengzhani TaxID=2529274 RepID=A0A4R5MLP9_9SPHI|nr:type I restriction enzyme HsdR N-terminal domain-containing protein [Pedobacter changchengzhani]TDG36552.1 type I restriction enzyme HsdR N-terminal domain-containing protein [Pedobacter changchengzhani]